MNEFANNLKRIRTEKNYTQEDLAEALHVTRQTVSGWETGRTEPDIETLTAMSEFLQVDLSSLIQGQERPKEKIYRKMQKKYVVLAVILGLIALGGIAAYLWLKPWILYHRSRTFDIVPSFLYLTGLVPLWHVAAGAFVPCLLSLWLDLRIKKYWNLIALILGIAAMIPTFASALQIAFWKLPENSTSALTLWFPFILTGRLLWSIVLPFFGGGGVFLGINRKSKTE